MWLYRLVRPSHFVLFLTHLYSIFLQILLPVKVFDRRARIATSFNFTSGQAKIAGKLNLSFTRPIGPLPLVSLQVSLSWLSPFSTSIDWSLANVPAFVVPPIRNL